MAKREVVILIDDMDGTESKDVETVSFGLDGRSYEIDLNEKNAQNFRDFVGSYVEKARLSNGKPRKTKVGPDAKTVRAWAQGKKEWKDKVPDRGRIPNEVLEAFNKAH